MCLSKSVCIWLAVASVTATGQTEAPAPPDESRHAENILDLVPEKAWGVLAVRNMRELDGKLVALAEQLNMPIGVGATLAMAKGLTGMVAGVEEDAGLALALMPVQSYETVGQSFLLMIPTANHEALYAALGPEESTDPIRRCSLLGYDSFMARKGRYTLLAQSRDTLAAALETGRPLRSRMADDFIARFTKDDVALYLDLKTLSGSDLFERLARSYPLSETDQERLRSLAAAVASIRLVDERVRLTVMLSGDSRSPGQQLMTRPDTDCSVLLRSLPDRPFILTAALDRSEATARAQADSVGNWLETHAETTETADAIRSLRASIERIVAGTRGIALTVGSLPGGTEGLVAATTVISCDGNSREIRRDISAALDSARRELDPDSRAAEILNLVEYRSSAEQLLILDVDHLVFKTPETAQPEARAAIARLFGKDDPRIRLVTPNQNYLVLSIGGGPDHLGDAVNTMRGEGNPLVDRPAVRRSIEWSSSDASGRALIAVDNYLNWFADLLRTMDQPPTLIQPEPVSLPVAIAARTDDQAITRIDVNVPVELLAALKTAWEKQERTPVEPEAAEPVEATQE